MKKTFRVGTPAWLVLLALFSIPALSPLFSTAPTRSADGLLHLYRLVQLDVLWQQGILFSRWLPDLAYGYGFPLFNYYAPLVYYLTTPLHSLGISFSLALNLSLVCALLLGAVGMFFFTRDLITFSLRSGAGNEHKPNSDVAAFAALVSALAFLYSPYILFNALQRGNLAEQWALAFASFALWRFLILVSRPTAWNWVFAILTFAAVMLSHNVTSFLFAPLLFIFTLACIFSVESRLTFDVLRPEHPVSLFFSRRSLPNLAPLSAFLVALMLSAFFWLPALLERDFAQIARVIVTPDFDYRFNFVPPLELVSWLPRADTGRMNTAFPSTLGITQVILAVAGAIVFIARSRTRRALPWFALLLCALAILLLMLAVSQPIWDNVSLLSFVQLPMRLRGLVALCLAPVTGIFLLVLPAKWRIFAVVIAILALILTALPLLYPRYDRTVPSNPTLADMFAYEQRTGALGTTSFGEYLPRWVEFPPDASPFDDAYALDQPPNRLVIPEGVTLCGSTLSPLSQSLCAESHTSWQLLIRAFYFPGWSATIDGRPVTLIPTPRTGLMSVAVPAGGQIQIAYTGTQVERLAEWFSFAGALLVLAVLGVNLFRKPSQTSGNNESSTSDPRPPISNLQSPISDYQLLIILSLSVLALKFFYFDLVSNPLVAHYNGTAVQGISQPRSVMFGNQLVLLGSDVRPTPVQRGQTLNVTLYLKSLTALDDDLSTFVHLTAPDGFVLAQKDSLHPANLPTTRWESDAYVADLHSFIIPPDLPSGEYDLRAGVYEPTTNTRLLTIEGADHILLQKIIVAGSSGSP